MVNLIPKKLLIRKYISNRKTVTPEERHYYNNLEKGFEGEQKFIQVLENLADQWNVIHNLVLEWNHSVFQIDTLLFAQREIYMFEVKNYEGDYYIESNKWYTIAGKEINNPILQLTRSESLLRQLLKHHSMNLPVKAYVIFIHPEFTLYQAPLNLPIVLPTQLHRFLLQLRRSSPGTNKKHDRLEKLLHSLALEESPYQKTPLYSYDELKKGITCSACHTLLSTVSRRKLVCHSCGFIETLESAVIRSIHEYKILFPN